MVGVEGFEPSECQSQNLMPYHLATPQYSIKRAKRPRHPATKVAGAEPRNGSAPFVGWGGRIRTLGMVEPESTALPLGDTPICLERWLG